MSASFRVIMKQYVSMLSVFCLATLVSLAACGDDSIAPVTQHEAIRTRAPRPSSSRAVERVVFVEQAYGGPVSAGEAQAIKQLLDAVPAQDRPSIEQALDEERRLGYRLGFPGNAKLERLLDGVRTARREAQSARARTGGTIR